MPLRFILVTVFLTAIGNTFAQRSETDSLESLVMSVPSDTTKVWLLNNLVISLREKDNNKAYIFAQQAKDLAELLSYKKGLCYALENLGWILYRKGDYSKSLDISTQALKICEEIQDKACMSRCLVNIAAIQYEQKQYAVAIDNLRTAYRAGIAIGDKRTMSRSLNNIAFAFLGLNNLDSALLYAQKGLAISEAANDPYMNAFARRTIGDIYLLRNNLAKAFDNFKICLNISVKQGNTFLRASVLHRLAKLYLLQGYSEKALSSLLENIEIAKEFGFKNELERAYKLMSEIYYKKNDIAQAYQYQSAYIKLHDSLYDQRTDEQISLLQIRFDTEMKQAQIELLTKEAALKAEELERQKVWSYFFIGCLSLVAILAFVLFYNNRHTSKARISLEQKNREIQSQTHQLRNLNSTKDKLFSIISHDLRSPVASLRALMEIISTSGLTQEEFVDVTKALKKNLDAVYDDLDNLLLWAQTQLKGLHAFPEEIELSKVADEKIALFRDLAGNKKISIINSIQPGITVLADKNHVSLILRNLITNAIKFNHPGGTIKLSSKEKIDHYEISVADSGIGITAEDIRKLFNAETHFTKPGTYTEKGVGIGLLLTKEFVDTNHGTIWVTSKPGEGTTFTFTLKASKVAMLV
jgi:two-component system sensor histidine kinase/response regulator